MTAEEKRLHEDRVRQANWKRWGPYLSERPGGPCAKTTALTATPGNISPRPCPLARVSLERGRTRRHLRSSPVHLLCARPLERKRSDFEGTAVRPHGQRRQSRRRRQRVLLLPRFHADALLHEVPLQVSAGGVPLRSWSRRIAGAARASRNSN